MQGHRKQLDELLGRRTIGWVAETENHRMGCRDREPYDGLQGRRTIGWIAQTEDGLHRLRVGRTENQRLGCRGGLQGCKTQGRVAGTENHRTG